MQVKTNQPNQKIPKLRFPGFSGEWEEKRLGEIFNIRAGGDIGKLDFSRTKDEKHKFPVYANALTNLGLYGYATEPVINVDGVTVTGRGDIGHAVARQAAYVPVVRLLALLPKKELSSYFFQCAINNTHIFIESTGVPQLTAPQFSVYKVTFPSFLEQEKIAGFLGSVDEWTEDLKNQKKSLESYKKGVMQKIFSQEICFKDENGDRFPGWGERRLEEVVTSYSGLAGKTGDDFGSGEPFITYKQIFDSNEIDDSKFALVKIGSKEKQSKVQFGDILFTTSSETPHEVGFASVLLNKRSSPYLNSFSFGIRPNSLQELDPHFSKFFFRSSSFRKEVVKLAQGSTRYNISKIGFMKIKIALPFLAEQQRIADFLTSMDNLIESKQQQVAHVESWKKGLMQNLFI